MQDPAAAPPGPQAREFHVEYQDLRMLEPQPMGDLLGAPAQVVPTLHYVPHGSVRSEARLLVPWHPFQGHRVCRERPRTAAIRVTVVPALSPSPIRTRWSSEKYLAHARLEDKEVASVESSSTAPETRTTVRPSPQRVHVLRFTPTVRHA